VPELDLPPLDLTCPRCGAATTGRFYGPCEACRSELCTTMAGERRDVAVDAFEPKMNVTPNAVALKG
jgi:hypothetical protein